MPTSRQRRAAAGAGVLDAVADASLVRVLGREIERVPLDSLQPHPRNPNVGNVDAVADSIRTNGFYGALIVQRTTRFILAGSHRWKAAGQLGMPDVPVIFVDVDDTEAMRILVADNRTSELAHRDPTALLALLDDIHETPTGLTGVGFDIEELESLRTSVERDAAPRQQVVVPDEALDDVGVHRGPVRSTRGTLYQLGPHRLYCGDSTDPAAWEAVLGGRKAEMMWTDPPYGIAYRGSVRSQMEGAPRDPIANDALDEPELRTLWEAVMDRALAHTSGGAAWYVAAPAGALGITVFASGLIARRVFRQTLVWVKDAFVFGRSDYHYRHEPIFYGWHPDGAHDWCGDRTQSSVLEFARPRVSAEHPTMKPVALVRYCIAQSTRDGALVVDPFGGSGTTLLAAAAEGRRAALIELEPKYCDVIRKRYALATGDRSDWPEAFDAD